MKSINGIDLDDLRDIADENVGASDLECHGFLFRVQSNANRERDFEHGRFSVFAVAGLLMTLIFLFSVYGLVQLVMMYVN